MSSAVRAYQGSLISGSTLSVLGLDFKPSESKVIFLSSPVSLLCVEVCQQLKSATMASFVPGLRRAALQISSRSFVCSQCLRQTPRSSPSRILNVVRSRAQSTRPMPARSPLGQLAKDMGSRPAPKAGKSLPEAAAEEVKPRSHAQRPKISHKSVAYWLLGSAASVFGIVVFGGLTRLTESG